MSLNDEYLRALDDIQGAYDLVGRSEAVRMAISAALDEMREMDTIEGPVEGVLIIVRGDHADPWMIQVQAKYQDAIKTQLHSHLRDQTCLEVMVISCDAKQLRAMMTEIKAQGKAKYVKFVRK
ncbi:MAG: CopG family transcriptional regulator [Thermoplasmata archaeon]|nr:CopG family transcriptional regulator [Thermoplasmata archaeon]